MRLESLGFLIDFMNLGSISATAAKNYMTEQGMSRVFRQLEKDLGVTLFKREGKMSVLTEAGREIAASAVAVVSDFERLSHVADRYSGRMAMSESAFPLFVTPCASLCLLEILDIQAPGALPFPVSIREENLGFFNLLTSSFRGEGGGVGIVTLPPAEFADEFEESIEARNLSYCDLAASETIGLVSASSPYAKSPFLGMSRYAERASGNIGVACLNDEAALAQIEDSVRQDNINLVTNNWAVIERQIKRSQVVLFVPKLALLSKQLLRDIACVRLPDEAGRFPVVRFGLVCPADAAESSRTRAVLDFIKQRVAALASRSDFPNYGTILLPEADKVAGR